MTFYCTFCGQKVKTQRGLRQHIDGKPECRRQEKAMVGISMVTTPMSRKKSPPAASIPKRDYDDTDLGHDFGMSDNDSFMSLPKAKRTRRFYEPQRRETGGTGEDTFTLGDKVLEGLSHKQFRRLLDKCALNLGVTDIAQEMLSDDEEQESSETEYSSSATESLSEDELSIIGGPDQDENTVNSDAQAAIAMMPPPTPHGAWS